MPSSSSEDEDLSMFREAADSTLYNDSLYTEKKGKKGDEEATVLPPSLRNIDDVEDKIHDELRVTPSFQMHVAKHLSTLLDSQIQVNESNAEDLRAQDVKRSFLKAKRTKSTSHSDASPKSESGVRLFGASAVFLSNLDIVPARPYRMKKRSRKLACFSNDSESSSEESDNMQKLSAAAVTSDWVLSGAATKGWAKKEGKLERCIVDKSGALVPIKDNVYCEYESLNEISSSNNDSNEASNSTAKDDISDLKLSKKRSHLESELAASFNAIVSLDTVNKAKKKRKKAKRRKREHPSEDATTETTEAVDSVERKKKKRKKCRKNMKPERIQEKLTEEITSWKDFVPGLLCEVEDTPKFKTEEIPMFKKIEKESKRKGSSRKKKIQDESDAALRQEKKRKKKRKKEKLGRNIKSFEKVSKVSNKVISKKKMKKKVSHLSEDLAKLVMNSSETCSPRKIDVCFSAK